MAPKTTTVPACSVRGCKRASKNRSRAMCAMHLMRFQRGGETGPAESYLVVRAGLGGELYERPSRVSAAEATLGRIAAAADEDRMFTAEPGRGVFLVRGDGGGAKPVRVATRALLGLEARGWVVLSEYVAGARGGRVTADGVAVLACRGRGCPD